MDAKRFLVMLIALIIIGGISFVGYEFISQAQNLTALKTENAALSKQLDTENSKTDELKQLLKDSGTDAFIERMAREQLGWVKKGEIKVVDKNK